MAKNREEFPPGTVPVNGASYRRSKEYLWLILVLLCMVFPMGCSDVEEAGDQEPDPTISPAPSADSVSLADTINLSEFQEELEAAIGYLDGHDFDGDGEPDELWFEFTGGAHCCYLPRVQLSSDGVLRAYPMEMDGGYVFGMPDGSVPTQFEIGDFDGDSLPEIFFEFGCYNGRCDGIPQAWKREFGIKGNWIVMGYEEGKWTLEEVQSRRR